MKHPKVTNMMFNFLFGFSKDDQSDSEISSCFEYEMQNHQTSGEVQVPFILENQNIDPYEYAVNQNSSNEQENVFLANEGENGDVLLNNIASNNSSQNRGPLTPLMNFPENSGELEANLKEKPVPNMIVDSSSESNEEGDQYMKIGIFNPFYMANIFLEANYEDPFGADSSESRITFNPLNSNIYESKNQIENDSQASFHWDPRSEGAAHNYSDLTSENDQEENLEEEINGEELAHPQPFIQNNQEFIQNMNEIDLDQNEEIEDFEICKINHEKHFPGVLSLRIICKIASKKDNVAVLTLQLIDLFFQKGNESIIERFWYNWLTEKIFKASSFDDIKKLTYEDSSVNIIKEILKNSGYTFNDNELHPYRVSTARTVHESLSLITYSQIDCLEDYEISESKAYKKFEGKLEKSPLKSEKNLHDFDSQRCTMHDSESGHSSSEEMQVPLNDSDDEDEFIYDDEDGYELNQLTNRISVAESWKNMKFENDTWRTGEESENPLESGKLFSILCRRFSKLSNNSLTENLLLTSIFGKLSSIPLSDENPYTYYLHAFMYWELKKKGIGLASMMKEIGESILNKSTKDDFKLIKYLAKINLGYIDPDDDTTEEEVRDLKRQYQNDIDDTVYSSIVFEEFLKEYVTIFEAKKYLIDMMKEFEEIKNTDTALDQAVNKLRKPIENK